MDNKFLEGKVLLINKPYKWTSFDVVKLVRNKICRQTGLKKIKVGHAGTLDPLATGLLIICTGKETKNIDAYQGEVKEYVATFELGSTTPSYDLETEKDNFFSTDHINKELIEEALKKFVGELEQIPPAYSAIRVGGVRAYKLARKGKQPELKPKKLVIDKIDLLHFDEANMTIKLHIVCSKGTYIRGLARDIGEELKSGAHMTALERTRIGDYTLDKAILPKEFEEKLNIDVTN